MGRKGRKEGLLGTVGEVTRASLNLAKAWLDFEDSRILFCDNLNNPSIYSKWRKVQRRNPRRRL